jgi:hypothetical protein
MERAVTMAFDTRLFRSLTPALGAAILLVSLAGCVTLKDPFSAENRIKRYLAKHPDRPEPIKAALLNQALRKDMTPDEVKLCWGAPNEREPSESNGVREEIWPYFDRHKGGTSSEDHGSGLFDYTVPLGRAVFTAAAQGLVLSEWTVYGEENSEKKEDAKLPKGQSTTNKTAAVTAKPAPETPAFVAPEVTQNADMSRWPTLRVTGILRSGRQEVALINNTLVNTGETIEGVTVVAVSPMGVYLQYGAETIYLTKGKETHPPPKRGFFK